MRPSVHRFTLSNMNISETSRPIEINFHLEHYWGGGKAAKGFGPDQIRTLVSMATDSSHRVKWEKSCEHSSSSIFVWIFFILAGNKDSYKSLDGFKIRQDQTKVCRVCCHLMPGKISIDL